ncbi:MAG: hypothetical protein EAZ53_06675 [Bacteroidetes bacterium]|nr:MAG: hypothetical protein EAZ53_06675 [Bacteroidota bacterium]
MKKVILIFAAGLVVALSSCSGRKDWNCTCTVSSSLGSANQAFPLLQLTEDEVKSKCEVKAVTGNSSGTCSYVAK